MNKEMENTTFLTTKSIFMDLTQSLDALACSTDSQMTLDLEEMKNHLKLEMQALVLLAESSALQLINEDYSKVITQIYF